MSKHIESDSMREACSLCEEGSTLSNSKHDASEHVEDVYMVNDGDDGIICDIGATTDVIGEMHCSEVEDIEVLDDPIGLHTAGNKVHACK